MYVCMYVCVYACIMHVVVVVVFGTVCTRDRHSIRALSSITSARMHINTWLTVRALIFTHTVVDYAYDV